MKDFRKLLPYPNIEGAMTNEEREKIKRAILDNFSKCKNGSQPYYCLDRHDDYYDDIGEEDDNNCEPKGETDVFYLSLEVIGMGDVELIEWLVKDAKYPINLSDMDYEHAFNFKAKYYVVSILNPIENLISKFLNGRDDDESYNLGVRLIEKVIDLGCSMEKHSEYNSASGYLLINGESLTDIPSNQLKISFIRKVAEAIFSRNEDEVERFMNYLRNNKGKQSSWIGSLVSDFHDKKYRKDWSEELSKKSSNGFNRGRF